MSLLVRAAVLGGLAYLVTRAVRSKRDSDFLAGPRDYSLTNSPDRVGDKWENEDRYSTKALSIGNP